MIKYLSLFAVIFAVNAYALNINHGAPPAPASGGLTIVASSSSTSGGTTVDNLDVSYPAGEADDMVMIICISDQVNTSAWQAITDWREEYSVNTGQGDCAIQVSWQTVSSASGGTVNCNQDVGNNDEMMGFGVRLRGHETTLTDAFEVKGTIASTGQVQNITVAEVTTITDGAHAFALGCFDGGEAYPFTITAGTDWNKEIDEQSGSGGADVSGFLMEKAMPTAGLTGDVDVDGNGTVADNWNSFQFAIKPE